MTTQRYDRPRITIGLRRPPGPAQRYKKRAAQEAEPPGAAKAEVHRPHRRTLTSSNAKPNLRATNLTARPVRPPLTADKPLHIDRQTRSACTAHRIALLEGVTAARDPVRVAAGRLTVLRLSSVTLLASNRSRWAPTVLSRLHPQMRLSTRWVFVGVGRLLKNSAEREGRDRRCAPDRSSLVQALPRTDRLRAPLSALCALRVLLGSRRRPCRRRRDLTDRRRARCRCSLFALDRYGGEQNC